MNAPPRERSKSVCVIAPLPPPNGGMSIQAEKLISNLIREGMSVRVIATNQQPPRALRRVENVPGLRTLIRTVQFLVLLVRGIPDSDIVHHFSASGLYFFLHSVPTLILGSLFRKKTILNYRGGHAPDFLRRWHLCVAPLMRLADQIAVPSEFLARTFRAYRLKAVILPNIADAELFPWHDRPQFAPRLLVTRRLDPMYNIECVLKAFRFVKQHYPQAVLTIAGDGSEERRLRDLVTAWELQGVHFCGAVPHANLPALYASHDIFVNASNVDNFPGALVEAASSGLPIVTTRAGGIPCMIRDRHNGILVELDDDSGLAAGVIEIIERPQFGRALAREARLWVEQFSWARVWPVLLRCYEVSNDRKGVISADIENAGSTQPAEMSHHEFVR
jgi:glycosyltransferase involved in cell wall biosynthesis